MAIENLTDRVFLDNAHEQAFTVAGIDLTGRVVKWSISLIDSSTGTFDPTLPLLEKTTDNVGDMTLVNGPTGEITVNIDALDTSAAGITAADYHFQLEVFDGSGLNGVVVSTGTITFVDNITETV